MATNPPHPIAASQRPHRSAADLFDLLWESLADVLGTAATATILRRAIQRAAPPPSGPSAGVVIERKDLEYHYRVPDRWRLDEDAESLQALRALARELGALLMDLTGPVLARRLERLAPFGERGIHFGDGAP